MSDDGIASRLLTIIIVTRNQRRCRMNLLAKLRELRRRLGEGHDDVAEFDEQLAELGLAVDDDPELILDTIDEQIATLEAGEVDQGGADVSPQG